MGIDISAKWEGLKDWQESERKWQERVIKLTIDEVERTALAIERDAKLLVPVDTGDLRNSIKAEINKSSNSIKTETGTDLEYANPVEFGSVRHTPQPYLIPSYDRNVRTLDKTISEILRG